MDRETIVALYDRDQRIEVRYPGARREAWPHLVRQVDVAGRGEGVVIYSQLSAANADAVIDEQIAYFEALEQDFEWKLYSHDTPADLAQRLQAAGFELQEPEAIMVLELARATELLARPALPGVRRVSDPAGVQDVLRVEEAVWEQDYGDLGDYLAGVLVDDPQRISIYVAYDGDRPVSAAWTYFPPASLFASLWGGATLPEMRNRGIYSGLLALRVREAHERGVQFLTVDASPMSQPILEKRHFELISMATPCKWRVKRDR